MSFVSFSFLVFVAVLLFFYYLIPYRYRWIVLLFGSIGFYLVLCREAIVFPIISAVVSYYGGRLLESLGKKDSRYRRLALFVSIILVLWPLLGIKMGISSRLPWIVPIGISFYTLQIIAYLVDIYHGKCMAEKNFFQYLLFVMYFPQIIQGPIPRFEQLKEQLTAKKVFDETCFVRGFQLVLWGWFLKLVIADKAGIVVDTVFAQFDIYKGCYVLFAGILYSIQLYTDFLACVCISQGVSELFGIRLMPNFKQPYFSRSVEAFWRNWHISLSTWLRDYIYIPLGGNRKGKLRKYINIMVVFLVSGMWHGEGLKYVVWGMLHGMYQIIGNLTASLRLRLRQVLRISEDDVALRAFQKGFTFFCVMLAWIIFRADTLEQGLEMVASIFTVGNVGILLDGRIFYLGLSCMEMLILLMAVLLLYRVESLQQTMCIRDKLMEQSFLSRCVIYLLAIAVIMVFGTYGFGFDAKSFIYGGF